ncbi:MAG: hypothetical protein IK055_04905 [Lachnospiraceae bacterium]|nr:hypothetical protein [Lachnospiraceae bacterium]
MRKKQTIASVLCAAAFLLVVVFGAGAFHRAAGAPEDNAETATPTPTPYDRISPKDSKKNSATASDKRASAVKIPILRVDGVEEKAWTVCDRYETDNVVYGERGAHGWFRSYSDAKYLYLFIHVDDDTPNNKGEIPTRCDCVEIFINEDGTKPSEFGTGDSHYIFMRNGNCALRSGADVNLLTFTVVSTDDGYDLELSLEWALEAGARADDIGFDLRINDSQKEGSRDYIEQWSDTSMMTHENLSKIGTLTIRK